MQIGYTQAMLTGVWMLFIGALGYAAGFTSLVGLTALLLVALTPAVIMTRRREFRETGHMLMVLGALLAVAVVVMVERRMPWKIDSAELGHVSERWLAEYRASQQS